MRKRSNWKPVLRRIAAVAAALVVLFVVSFESAKAFRWTFLLKLLAPVAETFGIYSAGSFEDESPVNDPAFVVEDTQYEQSMYASLEAMPSEVGGYKIVPDWTPDRFEFVQGMSYEDPDMAYSSLFYQNKDETLSVDTYIYLNDEAVIGFEFEKNQNETQTEDVNGRSVNFYHNVEDETILSASWIEGDAHYRLDGNVSMDELKKIIWGFFGE